MDPEPENIGKEILASVSRLVRATILIYALLIAVGGYFYFQIQQQQDDLTRVAINTNSALCTLRADLVQRVSDSIQFLQDHPEGIKGIPTAQIQQAIDNQQRTVDSLSNLNCPPPVEELTP